MRKFILTAFTAGLVCTGLYANSECKISEIKKTSYGEQYRIMNGFEFKDYSKSPVGLEKIVDNEIQYVKNDKSASGKYAVVGYSQGGVRSLAYATRLAQQYPDDYKNLSAVITVSGIDKGLKALDGGFGTLKSKATNDINTLYDGIRGVTAAACGNELEQFVNLGIEANKDKLLNFLIKNIPNAGDYISCAWNGGIYDELAEIYDMMPKSNFIKKNVADTQTVKYRVKTGTRTVLVTKCKKKWGIKFYYLDIEHQPIYKTYEAYKDVPKFSSSLPVGYIVGTNSNTLGMLGNDEKTLRKACKTIATTMDVACGVHVAKCAGIVGLFSGSVKYAKYCRNGSKWLRNINDEINEIKGSSQNDGLVAKESQYYPKTFYNPLTGKTEEVHTKVLGKTDCGYIEYPEYNHMTISPFSNEEVINKIHEMINESNKM